LKKSFYIYVYEALIKIQNLSSNVVWTLLIFHLRIKNNNKRKSFMFEVKKEHFEDFEKNRSLKKNVYKEQFGKTV